MSSLNYNNKSTSDYSAKGKKRSGSSYGKSSSNDNYQRFLEYLENSSHSGELKKQLFLASQQKLTRNKI